MRDFASENGAPGRLWLGTMYKEYSTAKTMVVQSNFKTTLLHTMLFVCLFVFVGLPAVVNRPVVVVVVVVVANEIWRAYFFSGGGGA